MLKHWDEIDLYGRLLDARKDAAAVGPARRAALCQRPRAHGHRAQQNSEGLRRALALDDGVPHAVRARMGLSRDADRVQGLARPRRARRARCPSSSCAACAAPKPRSGSISSARISCASDVSATGSSRTSRWIRRTTRRKSACCATWSSAATSIAACARCIGASPIAPRWPRPKSNIASTCRRRFTSRSRSTRNLRDAGALAADAADGAELAAAHKAGKLFAVIWTTTPWTLPANLGISLNATFDYVALKVGDRYYVVAARLAEAVEKECALDGRKTNRARAARRSRRSTGRIFSAIRLSRATCKLMYGDHVTADAGTGLVHTAPGHGYEDFVVGSQYGLKPFTPVDTAGMFTRRRRRMGGAERLQGQRFDRRETARSRRAAAHAKVLAQLPALLALQESADFSRRRAMVHEHRSRRTARTHHRREIDDVQWIPRWSRDRIRNMTETRPDWCLSRQRAWGVPIPALKCGACGHVGLYDEVMARGGANLRKRRIRRVVQPSGGRLRRAGPQVREVRRQRRSRRKKTCSTCGSIRARRRPPCSASAPSLRWPADAYLEAVEQARGWFGSSLACAVAERGHAPFRSVISHGLTVDEQGPQDVEVARQLRGRRRRRQSDRRRRAAPGVRLARLHHGNRAGRHDLHAQSPRRTARFATPAATCWATSHDFDPARDAASLGADDSSSIATSWRASSGSRTTCAARTTSTISRPPTTRCINFVVVDLSSLYIDVARDRLYCAAAALARAPLGADRALP